MGFSETGTNPSAPLSEKELTELRSDRDGKNPVRAMICAAGGCGSYGPKSALEHLLILQLFCRVLPQRIVSNGLHITHVVDGSRIGPSSLGKGALFHAPTPQQPRQAEVSFDAARLVINSVLLVALLRELLLGGPWPRPYGRIFDRDLVFEGLWPGARPALNEGHVLARTDEIS